MPAKFEFSLQPLLDRRKRTEEERQREHAQRRGAVERCALDLESLLQVRRNSIGELLESTRTSTTADLRLRDCHLLALESAIDNAQHRRAELAAACARAREALAVASRDRRAIEKLKERRREAFEAAQRRREELELDDANGRRYECRAQRLAERAAGRAAR
jgi:flagellar protein FliJ